MRTRVLPLLALSLTCLVLDGITSIAAGSPGHALPARTATIVTDSLFDANELRMSVSNVGRFAHAISGQASYFPGLEWPKGSGRGAIYSAGLWVGARVNAETLVTVAEYGSEFAAGPLDAGGQPVDPAETDPAHRVYKIRRGDNAATNPDWAQWPIALGAPSDGAGNPLVLGDQTLWSVYNDVVASRHTVAPGSTAPLGLEVRQTVFGFNRQGPIGRIVFVQFELLNKGPNLLQNAYVGFWCDPDLGGAGDDLVGCDSTLDLGYCYNAGNSDNVYGSHPPAVGIMVLKGPAVLGSDLGMTGFGRLLKDYLEPTTALQSYRRFQGIREDGSLQQCGGLFPTSSPFEVPGDPVLFSAPFDPDLSDTRCIDAYPADRRFLVSSGPFDFPSGTSRRVVIAILVGGRDGIGDNLGNLERLRSCARVAREVYLRDFLNIGTAAEVDPGDTRFGQVLERVQFDGTRTIAGSGNPPAYSWDFGDGSAPLSGLTQSHVYTIGGSYKAFLRAQGGDIPVSCGARVDIYDPGNSAAVFTDVTGRGPIAVEYQGYPPSDPPKLVGVDWGGRFMGGGFDTGCRFMGSSIVESNSERAQHCPGATLAAERFKSVLLDFGPSQSAYTYLRRELPSGDAPAVGRGFTYAGRGTVGFNAYSVVGDSLTPLEVAFTERQVTDDTGDPTGLTQPASQNGLWFPTNAPDGGHEYLAVFDTTYGTTPDPAIARDGAFADGTAPILFAGWLRLGFPLSWDDRDALYIESPNLAIGAFGADASWGSLGPGSDFLLVGDGDATSRLIYSSRGSYIREFGGAGYPYVNQGFAPNRLPAGALDGARRGIWGDYDGDGDADLFLIRPGRTNLLLNQGQDGSPLFSAVPSPLLDGSGTTTHAAWADYDLDGDLDLYVVNGPNPNQLLRNDGAAGFTDVTTGPLAGRVDGRRAVWADYDGDRDPDLFLCNGSSLDQLLRNDGAAGFVDVTPAALANNSVDAAWGDYDNDGDLDLLVAHFDVQLLRNDGPAGFTDVTQPAIAFGRRAQRLAWVDYDLDGDLDILVADAGAGFHLLANNGGGAFEDLTPPLFSQLASGTSLALTDLEPDGDTDFYLVGAGRNMLARNDRGGRWIHVDLTGAGGSPGGIGARVRVVAHGVSQTRYVTAADTPAQATTFGLGGASIVDTVEVLWPSGSVSRKTAVPILGPVAVTESFQPPARIAFARIVPNPSPGATRIELLIPQGNRDAEIKIHDLGGRLVWSRRISGLGPGLQSVSWDGRDRDGRALPTGIYFVRATYAAAGASARIVLIR
jgi:hypothetical protein